MADIMGACGRCGAIVNAGCVDADGRIDVVQTRIQQHAEESPGCLDRAVVLSVADVVKAQELAASVLRDR